MRAQDEPKSGPRSDRRRTLIAQVAENASHSPTAHTPARWKDPPQPPTQERTIVRGPPSAPPFSQAPPSSAKDSVDPAAEGERIVEPWHIVFLSAVLLAVLLLALFGGPAGPR